MDIKEFLRQQHIQEMLSKDDLKSVFECWGGDTVKLCKFLMNNGIEPLDYLNYIPYGMYIKFDFEEFTVPSNIKRIGGWAFGMCRKLRHIYIPQTVFSIRPNAFRNCNAELLIHCEQGSAAHQYAIDNNINFTHEM